MFKNNTWYWKSEDSTDVFARNNSNLELITGWSTSSLQHMAPGCRYIDPQTPSVFLVITDNKGLCSTIISNPSKESMVPVNDYYLESTVSWALLGILHLLQKINNQIMFLLLPSFIFFPFIILLLSMLYATSTYWFLSTLSFSKSLLKYLLTIYHLFNLIDYKY